MQGFDYKIVPTVPGIFSGFAQRKINIPVIPHVSCRVIKWDIKKNVIILKIGVAIKKNCVKKMQMELQTV